MISSTALKPSRSNSGPGASRSGDLGYYRSSVRSLLRDYPPIPKISDYIEGRRILPPDAPYPGFWNNSYTPYSIEIMDAMSPGSPVQGVALMKGVQIGATSIAENVIAYWMDENPAPIIYISATQDLLDRWGKRLEPLIDSCGFRHKLFKQAGAQKTRQSGDRQYSKEYPGGSLDMCSAQSGAALRSESKRIAIGDEIDGAPPQLKTGEGNFWKVALARLNAFGDRGKSFCLSTPTLYEDSMIYQEFLAGDQRKFFVPCPMCGKYQELIWGTEDSAHGIRADTEAGVVRSVYYLCEFCRERIDNHQKTQMLRAGKWEPTSVYSISPLFRSYHLSALYSPVGMLSWSKAYAQWTQAKDDPEMMRAFTNHVLGMPYREQGARPKLETVISLRGNYRSGMVPPGVIFLTAGADVQRGSERDPNNPPRIELEVCGHGLGYRSWSILYKVFEGAVDDPFDGAWEKLHQWGAETRMQFARQDGVIFNTMLTLIDSGDGMHTDAVYAFCSRWQNTYPSKGYGILKKTKDKLGDEKTAFNFDRYRQKQIGTDVRLYEISTNHYKTIVYRNLNVARKADGSTGPGFSDFPADYSEKYFDMLTAEERRADGSYHAGQRRNEALDCRVLCMAGHDIILEAEVYARREQAKRNGATSVQLTEIRKRAVMQEWEMIVNNIPGPARNLVRG